MKIDDVKIETKTAKLIFEFLSEENRKFKENLINSIKINNKTIKVDLNKSSKYEHILNDNVEDEFKTYECLFEFENEQYIPYIAKIYFNQTNIFMCGKAKNKNSVEIIFFNFIDNEINHKDCFITYNKLNYTPSENFELTTRKRINFLNIDIDELEIPNSLDNSIIDKTKLFSNNNCKNYQILISVSNNERKTISIFNNELNIVPTSMNIDLIIEDLEANLQNAKNFFNYKKEYKTIKEYIDNVDNNKMEELSKFINDSESLENKIFNFFSDYRENPTEKELKAYDLFSEFMLAFPFLKNFPNKEANAHRYVVQYYYSKKAIEIFLENIPTYVSNKEKIYLKYSACCCLRYLLYKGHGGKIIDLFYFLDFTKNGTIYNEAIEHNKKFINCLKEDSEMFFYFLQLNSRNSIDILTSKLSSCLSMLNCDQIKSLLFSKIPKYGIRINCNSHFNAITIRETRIICISDIKLFTFFLDDISCDNDYDFDYRYRLSTLLKNENFLNIKFSINYLLFNESKDNYKRKTLKPPSQIRYYKVNENKGSLEIIGTKKQKNEKKKTGNELREESGVSIEYFLTRGDQKLIYALRNENINSKQIFENSELMADKNLTSFIKILREGQVYLDQISSENIEKENYSFINDLEGVTFGFPRTEKY